VPKNAVQGESSLAVLPGESVTSICALLCLLAAGPQDVAPTPSGQTAQIPAAAVAHDKPAVTCTAPLPLKNKHKPMQAQLERRLLAEGLMPWFQRDKLSVAVADVSYGEPIFYAAINDDKMMYAASMPKIAILLTAAHEAAEGKIRWTAEFDRRLSAMITESSNEDASWGVDQVGLAAIEATLRSPGLCFYDDVNGGLWVGRAFRRDSESRLDPVAEVIHGATARQAARFYTLLSAGMLVSAEWNAHMLRLMGPPKHHHKFVRGIGEREGVRFLARKSGTWQDYHSDSALIEHAEFRYAVAAMSESRRGEELMQRVIQVIDDLVLDGRYRRIRPAEVQASR
jgi:beta-lactamase class A